MCGTPDAAPLLVWLMRSWVDQLQTQPARSHHQDTTCATTLLAEAQGAVVIRMATETETWMANSPCGAGYVLQEVPRDVGGLFPKGRAAKKDWSAAVGKMWHLTSHAC